MSDDTTERAENSQPGFDLLTFAGGLVFWSICTALSITGLMHKAGVATSSGFWAEFTRLYHDTVHTILSEIPPLLFLPKPNFTDSETIACGVIIVVSIPFVISMISSIYKNKITIDPPLAILIIVFTLIPIVSYITYGYWLEFGEKLSLGSVVIWGVNLLALIVASLMNGGVRQALLHLRNLLGAVVILTSLATTGYFAFAP